ncbi:MULTISPECIES: hypothetical protein [Neisseria]|uniref:hypothetical protein n=1 Tax=Neisseria TaxID=482 RepID=UPI0010729A99|nr:MULTISPECIES: hypothetical protein [Neisseria]MBF0805019.1 hypothetical protein [Neisseria sp. 19428wB4_WF04]TFU39241.1 hypothetical protein E4T99_12130 [Neisseria sp. WF04]
MYPIGNKPNRALLLQGIFVFGIVYRAGSAGCVPNGCFDVVFDWFCSPLLFDTGDAMSGFCRHLGSGDFGATVLKRSKTDKPDAEPTV